MKRETAGVVVLVLGAFVLALALWSSAWLLPPPAIDDFGRVRAVVHGYDGALGLAAFIAGVIAALLALPMAVTGARALCGIGIAAAAATLLGVIGLALGTKDAAIGPGAFAAATGALMVLAGAMLVMAPSMPPRGDPPPRDGRRLVYDANGKLTRIEQWADGKLESSRTVGPGGLVMDEPSPPKS